MRLLLLLLLTFLIPLPLLAASGQSQPPQAMQLQPAGSACVASAAGAVTLDQAYAASADAADEEGDEELSSLQGDLEDPTLPTHIATPPAFWQPFPHAFLAPLSWPSYLRAQLRPPPLA
ncbi:MAG: hypothetical protein JO174_11310 [Herbaspirillum sp.]|nr:hypothetical protein [Herbaspirillum sp.]